MRVLQVIDDMGLNSGVSSMLLNYYKYIDHDKVNFDFMVYNTVSDDVKSIANVIIQRYMKLVHCQEKPY